MNRRDYFSEGAFSFSLWSYQRLSAELLILNICYIVNNCTYCIVHYIDLPQLLHPGFQWNSSSVPVTVFCLSQILNSVQTVNNQKMKVLVKNDSKISFIVGSLRNSGFAPGKIRSVLWLYIKGDKWTQVTIKVFVSIL